MLLGVLSFEAKPVAQITQPFLISALAASSLCHRELVWHGSGSAVISMRNGKSVEEEDDDIVTCFTFHHNSLNLSDVVPSAPGQNEATRLLIRLILE